MSVRNFKVSRYTVTIYRAHSVGSDSVIHFFYKILFQFVLYIHPRWTSGLRRILRTLPTRGEMFSFYMKFPFRFPKFPYRFPKPKILFSLNPKSSYHFLSPKLSHDFPQPKITAPSYSLNFPKPRLPTPVAAARNPAP